MLITKLLNSCSLFFKLASLKDDMVDRIFFSLTPSLVNPSDYPPSSIRGGMAPDYNQPYESSKFMEARKYLLPGIKELADNLFEICKDEAQHYPTMAKEGNKNSREISINEINYFINSGGSRIEALKKIINLFKKNWGEYPAFGGPSWENITKTTLNLFLSIEEADRAIKELQEYKKIKMPLYGSEDYKIYEEKRLKLEQKERDALNSTISYANATDGLIHNTGSILEKILTKEENKKSESEKEKIKKIFKDNYLDIANRIKSVDGKIEITHITDKKSCDEKSKIIELSPLKSFLTGFSSLFTILNVIKCLSDGNEERLNSELNLLIFTNEYDKMEKKKDQIKNEILEKANLNGETITEDDLEKMVSEKVQDKGHQLKELERIMDIKEISDPAMVRDSILPYITEPEGSVGQRYKASPFRDFLGVATRSRYKSDSNLIESELKLIRFRKENLEIYKLIDNKVNFCENFLSSMMRDVDSLMNYQFDPNPDSFSGKKLAKIKQDFNSDFKNDLALVYRSVWELLDFTEKFLQKNLKENNKEKILKKLKTTRFDLANSRLREDAEDDTLQNLIVNFTNKNYEVKEDIFFDFEKIYLKLKKIIKKMIQAKSFCELDSLSSLDIKGNEKEEMLSTASQLNSTKRIQLFKKLLTKSI